MPFGGLVHPASVERGSNSLGSGLARRRGSGVTGHLFTAASAPEARTQVTAADQGMTTRPRRPHA